MKTLGIILIFVFVYSNCYSQNRAVGKLKNELANATHDTTRVWIMANICNTLAGANPDSGLYYGERALALARKIKFIRGEIRILSHMSGVYTNMGNLPKGLSTAFKALQIAEKNNLPLDKQLPFVYISVAYRELNEMAKSISFRKKAMDIAEITKNTAGMGIEYQNVGLLYVQVGKLDSAAYYFQKSLMLSKDRPISSTYRGLGDIQSLKGNFIPAIEFYRKALSLATLDENHR